MNPLRPAVPLFVACRERVAFGTNPLSLAALDSSLGRTSKFRPHSSPAGKSQPISGKLFAPAKASPFRERWHGEAVTERVASRKNPLSLAALDSSPEGGALGRTGRFRPHQSTAGRSRPISGKLFAPAKASPFRERWHGEAVTERVAFGTNPLSLAALDSSPERGSPWQNQQVSSSFINGRKKPAVKLQTLRPCQSLSLSGEVARRSRAGEGCFQEEPSQSPAATAPPRGGALGRTGRFRPHSLTVEEVNW